MGERRWNPCPYHQRNEWFNSGQGGDPSPLLSTGEATLESCVWLWASQYKRGFIEANPVGIMEVEEQLSCEERLRGLGWLNLEKRRRRGILSICVNT